MKDRIKKIIEESVNAKKDIPDAQIANIEKASRAIIKSLAAGGKLLIFGNGGSAADSQHMVAELVGRFRKERKALAAIALTANTSVLTALANDYGYDVVFSRQIEALGRAGDAALGISTSGNSKNVIEALKKAKALGMAAIGLTAGSGGKMKDACDICITASAGDTARAQECHIMIEHIICELVEEEFSKI